MPGNSTSSQGALQTLLVNDWTSGIHSADYGLYSFNNPYQLYRVPNANNLITSSANTYGVTGLPDGGLLLGPTIVNGAEKTLTVPVGSGAPIVNGVLNNVDGQNKAFVAVSTGSFNVNSYVNLANTTNFGTAFSSWATGPYTVAAGDYLSTPLLPFATTLYSGSAYQNYVGIGANFIGGLNFPIVGALNSSGTAAASSSLGSTQQYAIPANGRIWGVRNIVTPIIAGTSSRRFLFNGIDYTNPTDGTASNLTFGSQGTLIDYDNPASFGGWGTVSSSQVLLVKANTGGIIVSGDIFNPTISRAPAVQGTGDLYGQAAQTPIGLVYRSGLNGVWSWGGGANAQKLSTALSDRTWNALNTGYNCQLYRNFIFVDGGYFFDMNTSAWWRLPPYMWVTNAYVASSTYFNTPNYYETPVTGGTYDFASYAQSATESRLSVTSYVFGNDTSGTSVTPPTNYYNSYWESNPITISNDIAEVEEINIIAQGFGTMYVSTLGVGGAVLSSKSFIVNSATYTQYRFPVQFATDVLVLQIGYNNQIGATGRAVPIIESVSVKYRSKTPVAVTTTT